MKNFKRPLAIAAVAVLVGGWALFRPELLFVDHKVSEKLPDAGAQPAQQLASGKFASYAHETTGDAALVKSGGKTYLRFSNFKTSNGPDVHVYLVKGEDASQSAVNQAGFLDLGTIKGNVGDQNYELPATADLSAFHAVSVWCKRFGVDFGGATLMPEKTTAAFDQGLRLASYAPEIVVTHGNFKGALRGKAALIESGGKRYVRVTGVKIAPSADVRVLLVKAESPKRTEEITAAPKIELGHAKSGTSQFPIGDSVDAWLYRSVSLWDAKSGKSLAIALLRSDQETNRPKNLA